MKFEISYMATVEDRAWRTSVADDFCARFTPDWNLHLMHVPAHLSSAAELGAYHTLGLERCLENDSYVVLAEPYVTFLPSIDEHLRRCVVNVAGHTWDVVFTELLFHHADEVMRTFPPEDEMRRLDKLRVHVLKGMHYSGASAYLVNKWSKHKIHGLLKQRPVEMPIDQYLRDTVEAGELNAFVIYPFVTRQRHRMSGRPCRFTFVDSAQALLEDARL